MTVTYLRLLLLVHMLAVGHSVSRNPPNLAFSVQESTPGADTLARMLDSKVAYNVAYQWNRFGSIKNWIFEDEDTTENLAKLHGMQCARAEFVAMLSLPKTFQDYLPMQTAYNIHMPKKLCLQGHVVTEFSRIADVSFFTDFNLIEISRLRAGSITTWRKSWTADDTLLRSGLLLTLERGAMTYVVLAQPYLRSRAFDEKLPPFTAIQIKYNR